ncbi:MAG: hypothetical protein N2688_12695 [Burkholderiaceae bacterium]|nr:hypothetical protein [Burkholderiaceae bacterium]
MDRELQTLIAPITSRLWMLGKKPAPAAPRRRPLRAGATARLRQRPAAPAAL